MLRRAFTWVLVFFPAAAFGWGFNGHRRLAANAHQPFPSNACLRQWLSQFTSQYSWQDHATDPDKWRETDPDEWPRHYLDIDYADPISSYPRSWPDVQARFGQYAVANGQVPFRVEEMYGQLVSQFAANDSDGAKLTVAWLAHYVTDAFSPMHDTRVQPGDCKATPKCLHLRYESDMLAVSSNIHAIEDAMPQYYGTLGHADPKDNIFDAIIVGNPVGLKVIADDAASNGDMGALFQNSKDLTARRWGDSLTVLASLIGTAWVDAGKPMLPGMSNGCSTEVAQGELRLKGFPLPSQQVPDAGEEPDAGTQPNSDEDAGGPGGFGDGGLAQPQIDTSACPGCGGGTAALVPMLFLGLALTMRRRGA